MPYGGNDWLDITKEDIIEPSLPICDPHHHYWDLRVERTPYGRYLLHELLDDISGHNITSTVFIEARRRSSCQSTKVRNCRLRSLSRKQVIYKFIDILAQQIIIK